MNMKNDNNDRTNLIHCTTFESLKNILRSRQFYPSFCLEECGFLHPKPMNFAFAVVCFADLLDIELKGHMSIFHSDSYIKMDKNWAIRNGVSPVTYYSDKCTIANIFRSITDYTVNSNPNENVETKKLFNSVSLLLGYLKQYRGKYYNKKTKTFSELTQFYTEREWRYLPFPKNGEAYYITEEEFLDEDFRKDKEEELRKAKLTLSFTWNDILNIGVPFKEKNLILDELSNNFGLSVEEVENKVQLIK